MSLSLSFPRRVVLYKKERHPAVPLSSQTSYGAHVALQHCVILRMSKAYSVYHAPVLLSMSNLCAQLLNPRALNCQTRPAGGVKRRRHNQIPVVAPSDTLVLAAGLCEMTTPALRCVHHVNLSRAELSLGTLGGGNHFIELGRDDAGQLYCPARSSRIFLMHTSQINPCESAKRQPVQS